MASQIPPPEVIRVSELQVVCDGSGDIAPALGHPRVYLRIDEEIGESREVRVVVVEDI